MSGGLKKALVDFREWSFYWLVESIIGIFLYMIIAIVLYDLVADLTIKGSPITHIGPISLATPIDNAIGFNPWFVIIYVFIFYPFVLWTFGYFAFVSPHKFEKYFVSLLIVYAVAYTTYLLVPVAMNRPPLSVDTAKDFLTKVMAIYYDKDKPVNCFPSLHAANATLAGYWWFKEYNEKYKERNLRIWGWLIWIIPILVMVSTLFVRQHTIADEIYGFFLAVFAVFIADKKVPSYKPVEEYFRVRLAVAIVLTILVSVATIIPYIP